MSAVFDEREEYLKSPYFKKHIFSDYSPFYITVTICAILGLSLFILNFVLGCCSKYSNYWNDRHTGNRWLISLWTATPHQQPPLDYTELKIISVAKENSKLPPSPQSQKVEYSELQKRESDI
ncbi:uncharacterized protein LOC123316333 [Coccinella septempunctata]|uniref:uncharacterized protein LOC123316333 n=1 Tax=Coccinella septempunctata TaxID=41139 RepID=UPI001D08849C|nr:uncharacterized protein LOC123316333 [Coccinella septempunctata]